MCANTYFRKVATYGISDWQASIIDILEWSLLFYIFIGSSQLKPPNELKYNLHGSSRKKLHLLNKEILLLYAVLITHEMKRPAVVLFPFPEP